MAYVVVLLLLFGTIPLAFTRDGAEESSAALGVRSLLIVIPVLAAVFIARWATFVDADGIRVRALFGQRHLPWSAIRGLQVRERSVYAVLADGALRLPCVHVTELSAVARASGGRLPEIPTATPKFAPSRRRRG
jgi:hypothetical protein